MVSRGCVQSEGDSGSTAHPTPFAPDPVLPPPTPAAAAKGCSPCPRGPPGRGRTASCGLRRTADRTRCTGTWCEIHEVRNTRGQPEWQLSSLSVAMPCSLEGPTDLNLLVQTYPLHPHSSGPTTRAEGSTLLTMAPYSRSLAWEAVQCRIKPGI